MAFYEGPRFVLILRVIQAVLTILILGLTGYVANWWSGYWHAGAPSQVSFLLFCSVITLITLAYLIVVPMRFAETKLNHAGIITGVEGLTMVFWFAGFVALAVFLGDRVCFGHVCSAAKAAAAFGAFEWLAFAVTFVLAVMPFVRNRGGISTRSDPKMNMSEGV
ncbi:hypothetical protein MBLNU13_g04875t1 [Cladosporium sp. NU13]